MRALGEVLLATTQFLTQKGVSRSRRVAEEIIAHSLSLKRLDLYLQFDRLLLEEELEKMRCLLKRTAQGEPIEYIVGALSFYGVHLKVTPAALIPRPETELLVEMACKELGKKSLEGKSAWDVCTGSGCIGIALKKKYPQLLLSLADVSSKALELARENALANGVDVEFLEGDLLEPFAARKADFVFCNPPYVSEEEYSSLDAAVRCFEPKLALVGGTDGLSFYRRLKKSLVDYLNPGAKMFFEIGANQGASLLELFSEGPWKNVRVERDWAGHDRFFLLEFESVIH